jgi:7-cyano-7-deazaguanine reductase
MSVLDQSQLGKKTQYQGVYDPGILFPVARASSRKALGLSDPLGFDGVDLWNAYELSWLDGAGKPHVTIAQFTIPCQSPYIIESKSFKLYLNSFNQTIFNEIDEVRLQLIKDLSAVAGALVDVAFFSLDSHFVIEPVEGECIDHLSVSVSEYDQPNPQLLAVNGGPIVERKLYSHLLKSNCPITNQPDWATVMITYCGRPIDEKGLLKYIISYRNHNEFHEHCVERLFVDIKQHCAPERLSVYARYTRRGGLDINPFRSDDQTTPCNKRLSRQ